MSIYSEENNFIKEVNIDTKKEKSINKEEEEEENENENENENNFYSKYDEYYSEQPLLLKESNPKTKYNAIDLNNFYPKLKHLKTKTKSKVSENSDSQNYNIEEKPEEFEQIYNNYYKKNEIRKEKVREKEKKKKKII